MEEDFIAAYEYFKGHKACDVKVGDTGFCQGGGGVNMMAVRITDIAASVPYYSGQLETENVPKIKAPLCCILQNLIQQ